MTRLRPAGGGARRGPASPPAGWDSLAIDRWVYVVHNHGDNFIVRLTSSARKHLLTRTRISQALANHTEAVTLDHSGSDPKILFIGIDGRGVELEIIAVVLPGQLPVIHAMPTHYRRGEP